MEEIIRTLLLEGIDEAIIHRVLDVIEEEYEIIEGTTSNYLGTTSRKGTLDYYADAIKPKTTETKKVNGAKVSVKKPKEQVAAERKEYFDHIRDLGDKAITAKRDARIQATTSKNVYDPNFMKYFPKNVANEIPAVSRGNEHEVTKNSAGEYIHKQNINRRNRDNLTKKTYAKSIKQLQDLVQQIKNEKTGK